jgi:tRNA-2-methylthio-N6-dimethylallyladenosine synthase
VGFPGETTEQFEHTFTALAEMKFDTVHVAAYSVRPGTLASRLEDSVSQEEKMRRLHKVEELQEKIAREINAHLQGQEVEILVEGQSKGKWFGRTRTDKLVFIPERDGRPSQLVSVTITSTSPWSLQGKIKQESCTKGK